MRLITGGTGMLGRNILERTKTPCCFTGRQVALGKQIERETGHRFIPIDLATGDLSLLGEFDEVVHCAALSSPWGTREEFVRQNVDVTEKLVNYAISVGAKRFVHISSPSIYFDFQDNLNIEESYTPDTFANDYALTKAAAETALIGHRKDISIVILRPRGIFGKYDTSIFPRLLNLSRKGGIPLFNKGKAIIDITHVSNVVHAIDLALAMPFSEQAFKINITNDQPLSVSSLLKKLGKATERPINTKRVPGCLVDLCVPIMELWARLTGTEPKLTRYTASLLRYNQTLDISQAKRVLGYSPITSIDQGLLDYAKQPMVSPVAAQRIKKLIQLGTYQNPQYSKQHISVRIRNRIRRSAEQGAASTWITCRDGYDPKTSYVAMDEFLSDLVAEGYLILDDTTHNRPSLRIYWK